MLLKFDIPIDLSFFDSFGQEEINDENWGYFFVKILWCVL